MRIASGPGNLLEVTMQPVREPRREGWLLDYLSPETRIRPGTFAEKAGAYGRRCRRGLEV